MITRRRGLWCVTCSACRHAGARNAFEAEALRDALAARRQHTARAHPDLDDVAKWVFSGAGTAALGGATAMLDCSWWVIAAFAAVGGLIGWAGGLVWQRRTET